VTTEPPPGAEAGAETDGDAEPGGADLKLRAMRAVWLEMRDEDPPSGGLADLLAAARVKAEAMQPRPSWWQRLLAEMRRPTALALATIVVLIAGAVLVGRRTLPEAGTVEPPVPEHVAREPPATPAAGHLETRGEMRNEARDEARDGVLAPQPASPAPAAPTRPPPPQADPAIDPGAAASEAAVGRGKSAKARPSSANAPPPEPAPPPRPTASSPSRSRDDASKFIEDHAAGPAPAKPEAPAAETTGTGGADSSTNAAPIVTGPKGAASAPAAPVGELIRQCQAAAQRGDCPAALRLLEQITRTDRASADRISRASPVAKCLLAN
jgi:hypothetical protein